MLDLVASQTSAIAVIAAGLTGGKPEDFLPKSAFKSAPRRDQTLEEQRNTLVELTMVMGGTIPEHVRKRWEEKP